MAEATSANDHSLWGNSVEFWDRAGIWALIAGAALGVIALLLTTTSAYILYRVADSSQTELAIQSKDSAERIAKLNNESDKLRLALENEKTERLRLQELTSWRQVTPEQAKGLASALGRTSMTVLVSVVSQDPEASMYAEGLIRALEGAGCKVHWNWQLGGPTVFGTVLLKTKNDDAFTLASALTTVGIDDLEMANLNTDGQDTAEIVVGHKKRPAWAAPQATAK